MTTKTLHRVEVKDADEDKGEVVAVFSTFNVVDSDGDVTLPGAFTDGTPVRMSAYGHESWFGALPVGKGTVRSTKTEALFEGQFFMDTDPGLNTFRTVRNMGELQEWSYSVEPTKHYFGELDGQQVQYLEKLKGPHEVSPVLAGAGIDTRTLAVKAAAGVRFSDEAAAVLAAVDSLADRAADVMARRREKGKGLGVESSALIEQLDAQLKRLRDALAGPPPEVDDDEMRSLLESEYLRFARLGL